MVGVDSSPPSHSPSAWGGPRVSSSPTVYVHIWWWGSGAGWGLPEQAVGAGQAPVLAGQGGLDVFEGGQLGQVPQGRHGRLAPQHLGRHALDVTGGHVAWQPQDRVS